MIDTAVSFLPLAERNKRALNWAIAQLGVVANLPAGVLVLNQSLSLLVEVGLDSSSQASWSPTFSTPL